MTTGSDEQRPAPRHTIEFGDGRKFVVVQIEGEPVPPAPESLPVGTDSARAEAERLFVHSGNENPLSAYHNAVCDQYRNAFVMGAEWARAEERKARGE